MAENGVSLSTFVGVKAGMTRVFDSEGNHVPVTVIKLVPNVISQVKTVEKDGYEAYQLAYYEKPRTSLINNCVKGHLSKASIVKAFAKFTEVKSKDVDSQNVGKDVAYDQFAPSTYVDVTGVTRGKGFQGVMKRFDFRGGPAAHGSTFHRRPGSIGSRATPARVFAGKKMPGHMGCKNRTIQNLKVFEVNLEKGYMLIKGSIPGGKNSFVRITKSIKK